MVDEQYGQEEGGRRTPAGVGAEDPAGPAAEPVASDDAEKDRRDRDSNDTVSSRAGDAAGCRRDVGVAPTGWHLIGGLPLGG